VIILIGVREGFVSMLPKCSRERRLKAVEKAHAEQTQVNSHFDPAPPKPEKQVTGGYHFYQIT
jgi:hypothetical protein